MTVTDAVLDPCSYYVHRTSDWVTPTSMVTCGICHPPAARYEGIVRRGDRRFAALARQATARMTGRRPRCTIDGCSNVLHTETQIKDTVCARCKRSGRAPEKPEPQPEGMP